MPNKIDNLTTTSIVFGILLIGANAYQWSLVQVLTPFCLGPLLLLLFLGQLFLLLVSAIRLVFRFRNLKDNLLPIGVNCSILLIVIFVPFTEIWLEAKFRSNWNGFNEVVTLVEDGTIKPNEYRIAMLPEQYQYLSIEGRILIDQDDEITKVFFFTFSGVLDNYSGFIYRADDVPPQPFDLWTECKQLKEKRPHWYFCASY